MIYSIHNVLFACLLFIALGGNAFGAPETIVQAQTPSNAGTLIKVTPGVVTATDIITITFPKKHPKKMSIRTPGGGWYSVHEAPEKIYILPASQFSRATLVRKKVSEIKGVIWIDGKRSIEPVFSEPGEYLIYMADNLETEPENTFHMTGTVIYKK